MTAKQKYDKLKKYLSNHNLILKYSILDDDTYGKAKVTQIIPKNRNYVCQMCSKKRDSYDHPAMLYHDFGFSTKTDIYNTSWNAFKGSKLFDPLTDVVYCVVPETEEELEMLIAIES